MTVHVLNVDHPPAFNDSYGPRFVNEHVPIGTFITPSLAAYDRDGNAVAFAVLVTSSYNYRVNVTLNGTLVVIADLNYYLMPPVRTRSLCG